jgi:putative transposase
MLRRTVLTLQGSQFTADAFTSILEAASIRISMDGKGRALDNIFVERLWRTVKYEEIYLHHYETVPQLYAGLHNYFRFYNHDHPHQSLAGRSPADVYFAPIG